MPTSDRLRPHPEDRLRPTVQLIDLPQTAVALRHESHSAVAGHRQIAVFRQGPVSLLSFVFEPNGSLKEHKTDGVITILVLSGQLQVLAEGQSHDLTAGRLLALGPNVPHTVLALTSTEMLLTIHRTSASSSPAA
jgi:quercetin dioxygenase-like cupin family protein